MRKGTFASLLLLIALVASPSRAEDFSTCLNKRLDKACASFKHEIDTLAKQDKGSNSIEVDPWTLASNTSDKPVLREVDPYSVASLDRSFEAARPEATICTVDVKMPFSVARDVRFYQMSADAAACHKASGSVRGIYSEYGDASYEALQQSNYIQAHPLAENLVKDYVTSCTRPFGSEWVTRLFGTDDLGLLKRTIGIVDLPNAVCTGSIVNFRLLTARHCFRQHNIQGGWEVEVPDRGVKFTTLSGAVYKVTSEGADLSPLEVGHLERDWISLKIDSPHNDTNSLLYATKLDRWSPLVLIGLSRYNMALNRTYDAIPENAIVDISPLCRALAVDKGYIFHDCQTLEGMSGAPLLVYENGKPAVAGVHAGDSDQVPTPCGKKLSASYVNYAVIPR